MGDGSMTCWASRHEGSGAGLGASLPWQGTASLAVFPRSCVLRRRIRDLEQELQSLRGQDGNVGVWSGS